ncbi:MAG: S41 family peptidase [Candidatus Dojkabacteria bacterium]|nr:S41 family peptidase [Candidatus Dojkabacteria bacterium]
MIEKLPIEVARAIRGEKDTNVNIKVLRENTDGTIEEVSFDIKREKIDIDNVMWRDLGNGIIKIDIVQFSDVSVQTFLNSWDVLVEDILRENKDINGIVIDVRGNPGGFVVGVRYILEEFLSSGDILMKEKSNRGVVKEYKDERKGVFEDVPVVVLVSQGSASASEILAAGISENDRGEIVGMETVGKGVEQELVNFDDGSLLFVVFQQWLTPDGNNISADSPIIPKYIVENTTEDYKNGKDPQMDKALELLK